MLPAARADFPASNPRQLETRLADGTTIVAHEGSVEPRSIGSVVVSAYGPAEPAFRYDNFRSGIVWPRDGTLARLFAAELDNRPGEEIVVVTRSAGSGGYLAAVAFRYRDGALVAAGSVAGLPPAADVVTALATVVRQR